MKSNLVFIFTLNFPFYTGSGSGGSGASSYFATITPTSGSPQKGAKFEFQCSVQTPADAPKPRRIVWKKVGAGSLPTETYDDQRGRLYFYRVDDIHAGDYECTTSDPQTDAKAVATLRIESPNFQVTVSTQKLTLKAGESGEIICSSTPPSRNLEWLPVNKEQLPQGVYSRGGRLIVRGASPDHVGLYTCTAGQFGAGEVRAEITLSAVADLTVTPSKLTIKPGGSAELICRAEGSQQKVEWVAVNKERLPDGVYDAGDGRLIFQNANAEQTGLYSCNSGVLGAGESRAEVVVNDKPDSGSREGIQRILSFYSIQFSLDSRILTNQFSLYTSGLQLSNL